MTPYGWSINKNHAQASREGIVISNCDAVNYLLETNATDDMMAKTDVDLIGFTHPSKKLIMGYAEAFWNMTLRCDREYDECTQRKLIQRVWESIGHSTCSYWASKKNDTVHNSGWHVTSLKPTNWITECHQNPTQQTHGNPTSNRCVQERPRK